MPSLTHSCARRLSSRGIQTKFGMTMRCHHSDDGDGHHAGTTPLPRPPYAQQYGRPAHDRIQNVWRHFVFRLRRRSVQCAPDLGHFSVHGSPTLSRRGSMNRSRLTEAVPVDGLLGFWRPQSSRRRRRRWGPVVAGTQ